jgi:hypothetical protein
MINLKKIIKVLKAIDVSPTYWRIEQCNYNKVANLNQKNLYRKLIYHLPTDMHTFFEIWCYKKIICGCIFEKSIIFAN